MKILLFGATGSAGGSILRACLADPAVEEVRAIVRRPLPLEHEKLRVFIHKDFQDYTGVEAAFAGVDACLFCLGASATQVSGEEEYRRITYGFAVAAAKALREQSPGAVFHFISGQGTSLSSRFMWSRVKAETEREVMDLVDAVCWRPSAIDAVPSDNAPRMYKVLRPLFPLLKRFRSLYIAGEDLGRAMLQATTERMRGRIVENAEIRDIAERARASGGRGMPHSPSNE